MNKLISAITLHDLDAINTCVKHENQVLNESHNGWMPIEWTKRTRNPFVYSSLLRLSQVRLCISEVKLVLQKYIKFLSSTHWGPADPDKAVLRIWQQVYRDDIRKALNAEPDFILDSGMKLDFYYSIKSAGITSKNELVFLATAV